MRVSLHLPLHLYMHVCDDYWVSMKRSDSSWVLVKSFSSKYFWTCQSWNEPSIWQNICLRVCECVCANTSLTGTWVIGYKYSALLCVMFRLLVLTWSGSFQQLCMWFWEETCPWTADSTPGCWVRHSHSDTILTLMFQASFLSCDLWNIVELVKVHKRKLINYFP